MKAEEMTPFKRLLAMLKPDNSEIRNVYIFAAFSGIVGLGLPIGIQAIVNFIQMGRVSTSWIVLVVLVMCAINFLRFRSLPIEAIPSILAVRSTSLSHINPHFRQCIVFASSIISGPPLRL